ncbi:MAG: NAD-glutamate dehydrogenase [Alphaproteobacteria bacterium]|nr:NAD-glutamate dehydrogenase [Alphaproteobacteria bacterium]
MAQRDKNRGNGFFSRLLGSGGRSSEGPSMSASWDSDDDGSSAKPHLSAAPLPPPPPPTAAGPFADLFFAHADPRDLETLSAASLHAIVIEALNASEVRAPGETLVHVERLRDSAGSMAILIAVNDDKPFLFDSVMNEIAAQGLRVVAAFHPILQVTRDGSGRRISVAPSEGGGPSLESVIAVVFEDPGEGPRRALVKALKGVFRDVSAAVADWRAMLARLQATIEELRSADSHIPSGVASESIAFLGWLADNHFTFLGARDYVFENAGEGALSPIPDSGLGILRDPNRRVIRQPQAPSALTPDVRAFLMEPDPLIITKGAQRSTVHRRVHFDYIGVKRHDESGKLIGERRFVGLFTSAAYHRTPDEIPRLREKVKWVLARSGFAPKSHAYKALVAVLESYPRDELFQTDQGELLENALGVLHVTERPQTSVLVRYDRFDRYVSALVFFPRDQFSIERVNKAAAVIADSMNARVSLVYPRYGDSTVAYAHIIAARHRGKRPDVSLRELNERVIEATQRWEDRLAATIMAASNDASGALVMRYRAAFDAAYRDAMTPEDAVEDIVRIEPLVAPEAASGSIIVEAYREVSHPPHQMHMKVFVANGHLTPSDCLPIFENFGLKVIGERPFRIEPEPGEGEAARYVTLHDFQMAHHEGREIDFALVKPLFEEAIRAVWAGVIENDGFNRLTVSAGLSAGDVVVVRAIAKFLRQAAIPFSQPYMENVVASNPVTARQIVEMFRARFDPTLSLIERGERLSALEPAIEEGLSAVASLDEDRILRRFLNAVTAMLRTNFFREDREAYGAAIAFKFDSRKLDELPLPRPQFEIFVYSPLVEGVHLRFGRVARGGLRWSDRREDFRTEILGLVKAQQAKNAVIVPVGAKGGFFPKTLTGGETRDEFMAKGVAAYKTFIASLLSLTDNIQGADVVPPPQTVRHDGDDPYLVVAADKGTATFSDIANGIAIEKGFWLGDAFASGGSHGYDHKKMGITARGAWEAVKRHFREMGHDTQSAPFTVVGVGDMSGDVFGNGMLLSNQIKLVAAFDHRDIFIDPNPDPAASFKERQRLFALPRSSWADYDKARISRGGGVFSRSLKRIPLSAEMRALTGLEGDATTPPELIRALLKTPSDLLWFGGIGTYIKASDQSHAEVGDRANDAIRVDARDVRAKVVGEGANLGVTQAGRIEFARRGGRINSDAIDNSAGVDTSDHEVNLKILIDRAVASGALSAGQRDEVLAGMTDEIAQHVLLDNYDQTLALSIAEATAPRDLENHVRLMRELERQERLDRAVEGLPSDDDLQQLKQAGEGLTRPELAVLLAYAKISLFDDIVASAVPDDPALEPLLARYFPHVAAERFAALLPEHRLKREIIATVLVNAIVNLGGPAFVNRVREASGAETAMIVRSAYIAREIFDLEGAAEAINALDGRIAASAQIEMARDVIGLLFRGTIWVLRNIPADQPIGEAIAPYRETVDALSGELEADLSAIEAESVAQRRAAASDIGVPEATAARITRLPALGALTDITRLSMQTSHAPEAVAAAFFKTGEVTGIDRLRAAAGRIGSEGHWDRLALQRNLDDLFAAQRALTLRALAYVSGTSREGGDREIGRRAVSAWAEDAAGDLSRASTLIADLERSGPFSIGKLTLATGQLRDLAGA